MRLPLALRLARREMRASVRGLFTFLACLALGVAAIASVGSLSEAFRTAVTDEAASLMGGDLEVSLSHRPLKPDELKVLENSGRVSRVLEMRAMVFNDGVAGGKRALASLKAVDGAYPLLGTALVGSAMPVGQNREQNLAQLLAEQGGLYGAVVHPDLLLRIGASVGDRIGVGDGEFQIRGVLTQEPDRAMRLLAFGPRILVSDAGMERTGLARPGSMARYEYRMALPDGGDADAVAGVVKEQLTDPGIRVRTAGEAAPTIRDGFQRLAGLMALVGLSALLLGGLGVSEGVAAYLESKTRTIATFKALGAPASEVFWIFFLQVMFLAGLGIALGLAVGAAAGYLAAPALSSVLPVAPKAGLYPRALLLAGLFGLLNALVFAIPPLSSRTRVSPLSLFRGYAVPSKARTGRVALAVSAVFGLCMAWLVLATAPDARLGWGFLGSAAACAVAFWLLAKLLKGVAKLVPKPADPRLSLALRGLYRPGNPTGSVMACLGLGLTVLAAVALSDANFQDAMREQLPAHAPSFFFLDVQPYQMDEFKAILSSIEGVTRVETAPSLRGRVVTVKGVPVEQLVVPENVSWVVRGDRSLCYAREMPESTQLTAGKWWSPDYSGPPLVSLDAEAAKGLGLSVGDSITVSVLGREVELTVASLRRINWLSLSLNHALVLSPGVIDNEPMSFLATAYVDPARPDAFNQVYDRVSGRFGNVSIQRVDEALADVGRLAAQIALAVRASAVVTLVAGLLVLAQSLRAAMARRVYETVIFKVCGASRRDIMTIMLCEHGLAGLSAGIAALVLGAGLSWFFVTRYMQVEWSFFAAPVLFTLGAAIVLTMVMALAGMWRMLSSKAWPYLRNE